MALLEDGLSGNVIAIAAVGTAALALPRIVPGLAPPLRSLLKLGITLFFEAEAEMEAAFVEELVGDTMEGIFAIVFGPGSQDHRHREAAARIGKFERHVRARARRFGWDAQDRADRYRRHVGELKQAISSAKQRHPNAHQAFDHVSAVISEDW